jgi:hypothetical protein
LRKLYFDIDGTVLVLNTGLPKPALAEGRLEAAFRRVRADEIICVGNFAGVIRTVWTFRPEYDGLGAIFALCRGAFLDEPWFRGLTQLVADPRLRAAEVDLGCGLVVHGRRSGEVLFGGGSGRDISGACRDEDPRASADRGWRRRAALARFAGGEGRRSNR